MALMYGGDSWWQQWITILAANGSDLTDPDPSLLQVSDVEGVLAEAAFMVHLLAEFIYRKPATLVSIQYLLD